VPLIRKDGIDAAGATIDDEAITQLESGTVTALVITGGVCVALKND
jgi:hypothetical protein